MEIVPKSPRSRSNSDDGYKPKQSIPSSPKQTPNVLFLIKNELLQTSAQSLQELIEYLQQHYNFSWTDFTLSYTLDNDTMHPISSTQNHNVPIQNKVLYVIEPVVKPVVEPVVSRAEEQEKQEKQFKKIKKTQASPPASPTSSSSESEQSESEPDHEPEPVPVPVPFVEETQMPEEEQQPQNTSLDNLRYEFKFDKKTEISQQPSSEPSEPLPLHEKQQNKQTPIDEPPQVMTTKPKKPRKPRQPKPQTEKKAKPQTEKKAKPTQPEKTEKTKKTRRNKKTTMVVSSVSLSS